MADNRLIRMNMDRFGRMIYTYACVDCGIPVEYDRKMGRFETRCLKCRQIRDKASRIKREQDHENAIRQNEREKNLEQTVEILTSFFPEAPCNYNNMDELADCDYCAAHCDIEISPKECWKHAIEDEWWKKMGSEQ